MLVVDDDATMRQVCARSLSLEGWGITLAPSAEAALAAIQSSTSGFDCVLSDVMMPDLDGFHLIEALRRYDADLPVVLMTGYPSLDGAVRALDSGAVSYLTKPFDHAQLATAVARAARRHSETRMRRRAESLVRALQPGGAPEDLEQRFARAMERAWMAFQPIVNPATQRIFAYEALLRTDEDSLRRPDHFISAAERLGRVHQLGRMVRTAVARAAAQAPPDVLLFVNVHGLELTDEDLVAPDSPLAQLAPRVVLEITERMSLDAGAGPARVAMLRRLGYRIAVDDLGAGYAALGALASLEPDVVKLDMSLVRDLDRNPTKRRVVGAIANLCQELGGRVVAEGVETAGERTACVDAGIELLQGYLFARPRREFGDVAW